MDMADGRKDPRQGLNRGVVRRQLNRSLLNDDRSVCFIDILILAIVDTICRDIERSRPGGRRSRAPWVVRRCSRKWNEREDGDDEKAPPADPRGRTRHASHEPVTVHSHALPL